MSELSSKTPDRALVAAVTAGWIESEAPEQFQEPLFQLLDQWQADPGQGIDPLWSAIQAMIRKCFLLDAEISALRCLLGMVPDAQAYRLKLAEALYLAGRTPEAEIEWQAVGPGGGGPWYLLGLDLAAGDVAKFGRRADLAIGWARAEAQWGDHHSALVKRLVPAGQVAPARELLEHFAANTGFAARRILDLAWLYMHVDQPRRARATLEPLWRMDNAAYPLLIGRFSGAVAPYTAAIEAEWLARIDNARAEAAPATPLPDAPPVKAGTKVMVVGFDRPGLPNDMAYHYLQSGLAAGLEMHAHLDAAIAMTHEFRGTDEEVERRTRAFEAELERIRPHLVLVDWVSAGQPRRGLTPDRLGALARRLDFRVVVAVRDGVGQAEQDLKPWLPIANAIALYHPLAEFIGRDPRYLPIPVPALYPRPAAPPRDLNLSFVGAVNFPLRYALLSVLETEQLPFTAITGHHRDRLVPDMESYWRMLDRSRATLNISAHTRFEHLVTGRVWEAASAGTLLVEQENDATRRFFTPYAHYLPWRTVDDIAHIAQLVDRHPHIAQTVGARAQAWARSHFGPDRLWPALLDHAARFSPTSM
jgi:hypothetical protein